MKTTAALSIAVLLSLAGCTTVNVTPSGDVTTGKAAATTSAPSSAKKDDKKSPFKPWKDVLEDTHAVEGYFKTHIKRDNTLYLEVRPDQLEKEFGLIMHFSRGTGVFGLHNGLPLSASRLMRFERHGDKVHLVHVNHRFTADADSPMMTSLSENVGHSIVDAFDIASQDTASKTLLIDVTGWVVSDYPDIADQIKYYYANKPISFDKGRSHIGGVQGFPQNVEIDVMLTYKAGDSPRFNSAGVSDHRSVPVGARYSLFKLPEVPMPPRFADDRIGYFTDAVMDFSRDRSPDPFRVYASRFRLEKKDHTVALSEPVKPIVFYIDHSVPSEYRKYVKEGIEAWNKGFEAAGIKNAIVARNAPLDSTWSAQDTRYSTVQWTASYSMGYAIGPRQTDPRTSEILNADVLISSSFVRGWANEYARFIGPEASLDMFDEAEFYRRQSSGPAVEHMCLAQMGKSHELGLQHAALAALGLIDGTAPMTDDYLGDAIRDLVMHEIGHAIGLRHNFRSSAAIPYENLNDREFTRRNGLTASVMDYGPTNISPNRESQGFYTNPEIGVYDVWAIQYGYAPVYKQPAEGPFAMTGELTTSPEEERTGLRKIAERSSEPLLAYNTDEDTHLGAMGIDPETNTWDLSSDPLKYARDRAKLVEMIEPRIEKRIIKDGESYDKLRTVFGRLSFEKARSTAAVVRTIGGLRFSRDHKNTPGARQPFTPVPAARQREALQFISENMFSESAFQYDADLLNKLPPTRLAHWGVNRYATPVDYPIHQVIAGRQRGVLSSLLHNGRLARMLDNEVRTPGEPFTVAELLQTLTRDIWTEVGYGSRPRNANSFRRNLQRAYIEELTRIMLDMRPSSGSYPAPEDARSLARLELAEISAAIGRAQQTTGLNRTMQAHLAESKVRIDEALDVSVTVMLK